MSDQIQNISLNETNITTKNGLDLNDLMLKFDGDINKLKANVKWLYKYGGTGSRGGGNGSGNGQGSWGINVSFNNELVHNGDNVILNEIGSYVLKVSLSRPGSMLFSLNVKCNGVNQITAQQLSFDNNSASKLIRINKNSKIDITVIDEELETKTLSFNCYTSTFELSESLVNNNLNAWPLENNTVFINNVLTNNAGLNLKVDHKIYVNCDNIRLSYKITGNTIISNEIQLEKFGYNDGQQYSIINLCDINHINIQLYNQEDIAGRYVIEYTLSFVYNGKNVQKTNVLSFYLIPEGLFLQVFPSSSNNILYKNKQDINNPELKTFSSKISNISYIGYGSPQMNLIIERVKDDATTVIGSKTISQQVKNNDALTLENDKENIVENCIKFTIITLDTNQSKSYIYYLYTKPRQSNIDYYRDTVQKNITFQSYFRGNEVNTYSQTSGLNTGILTQLNPNFGINGYIELNKILSDSITLYNEYSVLNGRGGDIIINIGIQYSEVNNENFKLFDINFLDETIESINIMQNNIGTGNKSNSTSQIYIPKNRDYNPKENSKYDLLTIYIKRLISDIDNQNDNNQSEVIVYLNGTIEQALTNYIKAEQQIKSIVAYKGNYSLNLLEVSYIPHIAITKNENTQELENNNIENGEYIYLNDADIVQYYYMYLQQFENSNLNETSINRFINLYEISKNFKEKDLVISDALYTTIIELENVYNKDSFKSLIFNINNGIANITYDIPILVLNFPLDVKYDEFFKNNFIKEFSDTELGIVNPTSGLTIDWYAPDTHEEAIYDDSNIKFKFKLQGSSSGQFKSKNFNLTAEFQGNTEYDSANYQAVFTPNFEAGNYDSFLPEATFTCKADAVDSTHANNTSVGLFVNRHTTKFNDARSQNQTSKYSPYIKNCLLGFPTLVFFAFSTKNEDDSISSKYYYVGIYNFNLGRDSLYNLGYYQLDTLDNHLFTLEDNQLISVDTIKNGFNTYIIPKDNYIELPHLYIAEIQGGANYFDFSQFDKTILFDNDKIKGMFGDFYPKGATEIGYTQAKLTKLVEGIAKTSGYLYTQLGKNFSESIYDNYGYNDKTGYNAYLEKNGIKYYKHSINQVPNYKHQFYATYVDNELQYNVKPELCQDGTSDDGKYLLGLIDDELVSEDIKYKDTSSNNTFYNLLDYTSLVEYYTICMAFGLVDSVMKNLNLKSFAESGPFYAAFYDMDTSLGRANGGEIVSPFAFSDYWTTNEYGQEVIYRDFYPLPTTSWVQPYADDTNLPLGYDIPSSYLFAIPKYARLFIENNSNNKAYNNSPSYWWAQLRANSDAPLANAQKFVDNYFGIDTDKIPEIFWNMNYRFKFLQKSNNAFNSKYKTPFHGRGKAYLSEWLSNRLHILDAYFNINCMNVQLMKYDLNSNRWIGLTNDQNKGIFEEDWTQASGFNEVSLVNTDIYILQTLFRQESGDTNKFQSSSVGTNIKALEYSPMCFKYPFAQKRFLCIDPNKIYSFSDSAISEQGVISILFGGSIAWTYAESLHSFITSTKELELSNAKYLQNITIKSGSLDKLILGKIPAVQDITITSSNAKCQLDVNGDDDTKDYTNLKNIDLHNSGCSLVVNNVNVNNINLSNIKTNNDITISNCNNLINVNVNNMECSNLTITSLWSNNIQLSNTKIKGIFNITNNRYLNQDCKLILEDDASLTQIIVNGFTHLYINNCPKLQRIIINENDNNKLKVLYVKNCNTQYLKDNDIYYNLDELKANATEYKLYIENNLSNLNNDVEYPIIDLSVFESLQEVSLEGSQGFDEVRLPEAKENSNNTYNIVRLAPSAFSNTYLTYLNRPSLLNNYSNEDEENILPLAIITGEATFVDTFYAMEYKRNGNNLDIFDNFGILNTCTSLASTFAIVNLIEKNTGVNRKHITNPEFIRFLANNQFKVNDDGSLIKLNKTILDQVTNCASMYAFQNITYNNSSLITDSGATPLTYLTNVINASSMFINNDNFEYLTKTMIGNFAINSSTLDFNTFITNRKNTLYVTIGDNGTFQNIISKVTNFISSENYPMTLSLPDGLEFKVKDLFKTNNGYEELFKLTSIIGLSISVSNNNYIDFENAFEYLPNLERISNSFNGGQNAKNLNKAFKTINGSNIDYFQSSLKYVASSFNINNNYKDNNYDNIDAIDFYTFINWKNILSLKSSGNYIDPKLLTFKKYIYQNDFEQLGSDLNSDITYIDYIFQNCDFRNNDSTQQFIIPESFRGINSMNYTFQNITVNNKPFYLGKNSFPTNNLVKSLISCFANNTMMYGLPINVFNKRYDESNYSQHIQDLSGCFSNISLTEETFFNWNRNENELSKAQALGLLENPEGIYFDFIKLADSHIKISYNENKSYLIINKNDSGYRIFTSNDQNNGDGNLYNCPLASPTNKINNVVTTPISTSENNIYIINKYILPYDIFYSCTNGCKISNCFANSKFEGILPYNLFGSNINGEQSRNLKFESLDNVFKGLNVIPQKFDTSELYVNNEDQTNISNIIPNDIYVFVPHNFIPNNTVFNGLANSLTFSYSLPDSYDNHYYSFYLMYSDSIGDLYSSYNNLFTNEIYAFKYLDQFNNNRLIVPTMRTNPYNIRFGICIDAQNYLSAKTNNVSKSTYEGIDVHRVEGRTRLLNGLFNSTLSGILFGHPIKLIYDNGNSYALNNIPIESGFENINVPVISINNISCLNRLFILPEPQGQLNNFLAGISEYTPPLYKYQMSSIYKVTINGSNYPDLMDSNVTIYESGVNKTIKLASNDSETNVNQIKIDEVIEDPIIVYWQNIYKMNH